METPAGPKRFEPFIPSETLLREFTPRAVITGIVLGSLFGASSLYLVLKVGLTVSASIPVAVISLTLFRLFSKIGVRDSTILENNITQTAGSAGESIAFGVGVTMPAIMILGFDLELTRVMLVAILGGLLGILMMIPLRRALIVKEHGILKYPEGTACAAVLKAGANAEDIAAASPSAKAELKAASDAGRGAAPGAKIIFTGFGLGLLYKTLNVAFKGWKDVPGKVFNSVLPGGSVSCEISPELLGVGYIIGPRVAGSMAAGGVLAYLVLIPMIKFFGEHITTVLPPGTMPIAQMGPHEIRSAYVLYIGAGAVAAGGIISLIKALPTIWHGIRGSLGDIRAMRAGAASGDAVPRTDRDLSMKFVLIGSIVLLAAITLAKPLHMNLLGAVMVLACGFLFVTVSSRITGEVGSTSNPISGMTIATLLLTCLVFLVVGWTGNSYYVTALSVGAIVCIASSNGGTTSQDLKTGFLVGGTPKFMQYAILLGAFGSALLLGPILIVLNDSATVYVPAAQVAPAGLSVDVSSLTKRDTLHGVQAEADRGSYFVWQKTDDVGGPAGRYLVDDAGKARWLVDPGINGRFTTRPDGTEVRKLDAPKATLVSYIIKGILDRKLPWGLVLLGVMIALTMELCGVSSLVFAVGVYLPISSSLPLLVGGAIRWWVDARERRKAHNASLTDEEFATESDKSPGVLLSSGYIAGGAIAGIIIAFLAGVLSHFDHRVTQWAESSNPFFAGANADALSLLPFAALCLLLLGVARGRLLR
ncbi:OPT family oligopeptide transporter [Nibricoccus sp. IMCC34717]|uniref:OPT family oligopeptide transporter n=1 Tax=Nibricoccus sp. IMCC34717 TaxID=3034021 RepID=UPI0038506D65